MGKSGAEQWTVSRKPGSNGRRTFILRESSSGRFVEVRTSDESSKVMGSTVKRRSKLLERLAKR